jgi:hypothetical protein
LCSTGQVTCEDYGGGDKCIVGLMGNPEEKSPVGRSRSTLDHTIKIDFNRMEWDGVEYIRLAQYKDKLWVLVKFSIPQMRGNS